MPKHYWENQPWYSSYKKNNYGDLFYALMRVYQPGIVVELGTKAGYSAYHIARGLKANRKGHLYCYDLWEKYSFRSVPKVVAEKNLKKFKDIVSLRQLDVVDVEKKYKMVDILHVDISNDGEKLERIIPKWLDKVRHVIIIEGGSEAHDKLDWMVKYKRPPIRKWLQDRRGNIEYITIETFPSLTLIWKR